VRAEAFSKKLDSDDHFDCPFSFTAMKENYETKKKEITPTAIPASTKNHNLVKKGNNNEFADSV
jgi:hypothetical protein